ncbi:hypothetical protein CVT24_008709 [Panaeolus cyanescens]|uniref:Gfo/Idh/MocA-like oxidoreductase N-terminal domain-containing protein n=1 Tax=Panaeolus cyanescens TaxID=181874 RepID=A0A409VKF5_9AGAR|nr:hypothetical protein CVT24_008709 [Panaeolus cyanescens]
MSSIIANTKNIWRRSTRLTESPFNNTNHSAADKPRVTGSVKPTRSSPTEDVITIAVVGCGQRGKAYANYAFRCPELCKIVAIAEPRPRTKQQFAQSHNIDQTLVFDSWEELLAASAETIVTVGKRLADAVIVAVQDHMHLEVVEAFSKQGYHVLCEKPMATNPLDCLRMEAAVKASGAIFGMGHVMRYSPYSKEITDIIRSGSLGELVNAVHVEPVGYYHFAHSDIDLLCHWFKPAIPVKISSFGSLRHFRQSAKPTAAGNTTRCLDCPIERNCPYSAKKIYLDPVSHGNTGWPVETIVDGLPDIENVTEALRDGPYGRCVYESANDVCDNQVVNIEFSNGSTASFTMVAFTDAICDRQTRLHFSHGEIIGNMNTFTVSDFRKRSTTTHRPRNEGGGHGGGDMGLISSFVEAVRTNQQKALGTTIDEVVKSHLTVFAAEESRLKGIVVDYPSFEMTIRKEMSAPTSGNP